MEIQKSDIVHPASKVEDIALTATLPTEMVRSQQELIVWCEKKISVCQYECRETYDAYERAKKMKWKDAPLRNLWRSASQRLAYYEKVKAALEAGYYIVPNFDIQFFAIRTNDKTPKGGWLVGGWNTDHKQKAKELPIGQGEYQNPFPLIDKRHGDDGKGNKWVSHKPESWDTMEFPIMMAKPDVMEATSRALSLKIFDRIGVYPKYKKEDPVIIGQIFRKDGTKEKIVSFMIAWHLNTNMI
jgi:hypothetical protein